MKTLLIANRGEIARRIITSARANGWRTVAIHSDIDADALHVREADLAVRIGNYLDIGEVIAAAQSTGSTHVHPGYGFLSERAPFARALATAGLTLVGPSAEVMDAMGRKDAAREIAIEAGVPVVPSYDLPADGEDVVAQGFDYPILVKAAAGGGGKGMRVVRSAAELPEALAAARREATSSFGDDTMLIEKYVESGRHIEVQVFADSHGNVVHLFERDCSTQRRHQKVLEEAPAPTITPAQRDQITAAAVALSAKVGYLNAGTVEFLLDNSVDGSTGEGFYFLEMNTRLQVEHPVTEEVVLVRGERVDLVALQLQVASGEPLGFVQDDVTVDGHAIEARVYAEDSFGGFLPQAGTATWVDWPAGSVRVDHALESRQEVSTAYDPMLGKVIVRGTDREQARLGLIRALDHTAILGLTTNTGFLRTLLATPEFREATIDTAWLDRNEVDLPSPDIARLLAAHALAPVSAEGAGPWHSDGFRVAGEAAPVLIELDRLVAVRPGSIDERPVDLLVSERIAPGRRLEILVDGERHEGAVGTAGTTVEVVHRGQRHLFERPDPFADSGPAAGDGTLLAPMPGTLLEVRASPGDEVAEGDALGVMEAMKMELVLKAPFAGTVTEVGAAAGQQVPLGSVLFVVEERE